MLDISNPAARAQRCIIVAKICSERRANVPWSGIAVAVLPALLVAGGHRWVRVISAEIALYQFLVQKHPVIL